MSIEVTCLECGSSHLVNDRMAGRRVRCPSCDSTVEVPERAEMEDAERRNVAAEVVAAEVVAAEVVAAEVEPEPPITFEKHEHVLQSAGHAGDVARGSDISVLETFLGDADEEDHVLPRKKRPGEEMDMTPMVDVTFLLLIFFMVTAAFSLQKSIEMPRQQTDQPSTSVQDEPPEELDMVEVQVDEFGSFLVMAPEWERETPGKQNLISALREAIAGNKVGMKLVVKVHELAKLHALVDAMDAGTIAGFSELEVTQVEDFD